MNKQENKLAREKSPYLLQHAHNPVAWFPWSEEAFARAKAEDKPIFLSIGYSTCHWCHVMAHESFEDEEVAALLNEHFISIKVDREERPDIDNIYMKVCQTMTGEGGWPLTIVMTPAKEPFFAGTYFPKKTRWGRPGLIEILKQLADVWKHDRERVLLFSRQLTDIIQKRVTESNGKMDEAVLERAFLEFDAGFDEEYGGFGDAPKFPMPHYVIFLLRYWKRTGKHRALEMVEKTLESMIRGGIWDHIGFGFHRYSTDRRWLVPHFEKMLYDNALLAYAFLEAFEATRNQKYACIAEQIFSYVDYRMTSPDGGFYTAEDADSEGIEGKFYVWTPEEIKKILGPEEGTLFCSVFNISERGNFNGKSIPNLIDKNIEDAALDRGLPSGRLAEILDNARKKLFEEREKRIHPHLDDKILTSWNSLMIAALAKGAKVLGDGQLAKKAEKAVHFIMSKLQRNDGRLLARFRENEAAFLAYLDDYAFLIWGLLELYETTFDPDYLNKALRLNEKILELFWDEREGGFFFYGSDSEQLFARLKEAYDGALPSGNSVAALNLLKLSRMTKDPFLEEKARHLFSAFAADVTSHPSAYAFLLTALLYATGDYREIVITGDPDRDDTRAMIQMVRSMYMPDSVVLFCPNGDEGEKIRHLIPRLQELKPIQGGKATAYVCENYACRPPITDPAHLKEIGRFD